MFSGPARLQLKPWPLPSKKTEGEALTAIRGVQRGNGVEAWRKLLSEYRPSSATQALGYMVEIVCLPHAKDSDHAMATLNAFEENVRSYEECDERYRVDDVVKFARIQKLMPLKI